MRAYHETLHGSVTDQARRQHVGWWLWLEDVTPIKADECWSSIIRADLRTFTGDRKKAWLERSEYDFRVGPSHLPSGSKAARIALARSIASFRDQIRRWMEPFRSEKPLRWSARPRCTAMPDLGLRLCEPAPLVRALMDQRSSVEEQRISRSLVKNRRTTQCDSLGLSSRECYENRKTSPETCGSTSSDEQSHVSDAQIDAHGRPHRDPSGSHPGAGRA